MCIVFTSVIWVSCSSMLADALRLHFVYRWLLLLVPSLKWLPLHALSTREVFYHGLFSEPMLSFFILLLCAFKTNVLSPRLHMIVLMVSNILCMHIVLVYFILSGYCLTLLVAWQEEHPACKNWVVRYWRGCIWSSWCHCHPIIFCSSKIQNGLPFWCQLTQVVLEKRPLNGCSRSNLSNYLQCFYVTLCFHTVVWMTERVSGLSTVCCNFPKDSLYGDLLTL